MSAEETEIALAKRAKQSSLILGALSSAQRNDGLQKIHDCLIAKQQEILAANKLDMRVTAHQSSKLTLLRLPSCSLRRVFYRNRL